MIKRIGELKITGSNLVEPVVLSNENIIDNEIYYSFDRVNWVKDKITLNHENGNLDKTVYFACATVLIKQYQAE